MMATEITLDKYRVLDGGLATQLVDLGHQYIHVSWFIIDILAAFSLFMNFESETKNQFWQLLILSQDEPLWSSKLLQTAPESVREAHLLWVAKIIFYPVDHPDLYWSCLK